MRTAWGHHRRFIFYSLAGLSSPVNELKTARLAKTGSAALRAYSFTFEAVCLELKLASKWVAMREFRFVLQIPSLLAGWGGGGGG